MSKIDPPLLDNVGITFFNRQAFDTPYLHLSLGCVEKSMPCTTAVTLFQQSGRHIVHLFLAYFSALTIVDVFIAKAELKVPRVSFVRQIQSLEEGREKKEGDIRNAK